jgi:hypothetical protein
MVVHVERIDVARHIADYDVLITADQIIVSNDAARDGAGERSTYSVPNHGTRFGELATQPGFRLGWARFPDDAEVLYRYDLDDYCFGYTLNLTAPDCSEWGYAPFEEA